MCRQCLMCFLEELSGQMAKKCNAAFLETGPLSLLVNDNECITHLLAFLCHLLKRRRRRSGLYCMKRTDQKSCIHFTGLWGTQSIKQHWILCCRHECVIVRCFVSKCGRWLWPRRRYWPQSFRLSALIPSRWVAVFNRMHVTYTWAKVNLNLKVLYIYRLESFKCQESVIPMTGLADVHLLHDPKHSLKTF